MKLFTAVPFFLLAISFNEIYTAPCAYPGISCSTAISSILCDITTDNGVTASYLFNKCTREVDPQIVGHYYDIFGFNDSTLTLDIPSGSILIGLNVYGQNNEVIFNNSQPDMITVALYSPTGVNVSQNFLENFPNLNRAYLNYLVTDGFPFFHDKLEEVRLIDLYLPSVFTVQSSNFHFYTLTDLDFQQSADREWYRLAPDAFDGALSIEELQLYGLRHFNSFQFANLVNLTELSLRVDYPSTTFDENAFAGLNAMTFLRIVDTPNLDFILSYTFPNLLSIRFRDDGLTTLDQEFFQRQKQLTRLDLSINPFNCSCEMAWVSFVANNLSWSVGGSCSNGNGISEASNYANCTQSSYLCFNSTFVCPTDSRCVNTAVSASCECNSGEMVAPGDTCSASDRLIHQSTLSLLLLFFMFLL